MVPMGLQHDIPTNIHISTNWACTYNLKKKKAIFLTPLKQSVHSQGNFSMRLLRT